MSNNLQINYGNRKHDWPAGAQYSKLQLLPRNKPTYKTFWYTSGQRLILKVIQVCSGIFWYSWKCTSKIDINVSIKLT